MAISLASADRTQASSLRNPGPRRPETIASCAAHHVSDSETMTPTAFHSVTALKMVNVHVARWKAEGRIAGRWQRRVNCRNPAATVDSDPIRKIAVA